MKNRVFFIITLGAIVSLIFFRSSIVDGLRDLFENTKSKVVIHTKISSEINQDSIDFGYKLIGGVGNGDRRAINLASYKGKAKWVSNFNRPYQIYTGRFIKNENQYWLGEPGDNVTLNYDGRSLRISGRGSEKYILQQKLYAIRNNLRKTLSNPLSLSTKSMDDYLEWCEYLKKLYQQEMAVIDSFKTKISPFAFNYIRDVALDNIIDERCTKFNGLLGYAQSSGLSLDMMCDLYDSTCAPFLTSASSPSMSRSFVGSWAPLRLAVGRKYSFNMNNPDFNTEKKRKLKFYELGSRTYTGLAREAFLAEFLTNEMIAGLGLIPEVVAALANYYAEPGYADYKQFVKKFEIENRGLKNNVTAPDFILTDLNGRKFYSERLKNKVVLLNFWSTGNQECAKISPVLQSIEKEFKNDTNLMVVHISVDKDQLQWKQSVQAGVYTSPWGINVCTNGKGTNDAIITNYNVTSFPDLYMIDGTGAIIHNPLPDPKDDNGSQIIAWIKEQLLLLRDGPYVIYEQNGISIIAINGLSVSKSKMDRLNNYEFMVQSEKYNTSFPVKLKNSLSNEPSVFAEPAKMIAISDIEGNLSSLVKLLRLNTVIDDKFNWIFGNGHVVLTGNVCAEYGEGRQVIECLWLIYSLEEKAKSAGGYVHYILGNKEIRWLNASENYFDLKYRHSAMLSGKTTKELFNSSTELGKWLRTKNIIEKIGNILFVNSGISQEINSLDLTVSRLNELARPYLDRELLARTSPNKPVATLFNYDEKLSPFWYKNYYLDEERKILIGGKGQVDTVYKTSARDIENTLKEFEVNRIVSGNILVAYGNNVGDTISLHYAGKVINIYSRHGVGKSEALLKEGNTFYRVNGLGQRFRLLN
jgi:thiol-disulfide isomerase/thioredoxin